MDIVSEMNNLLLIKSLCGLNNSSRMWNLSLTIDSFLKKKCGMSTSDAEECFYSRYKNVKIECIMMIYRESILILTTGMKCER